VFCFLKNKEAEHNLYVLGRNIFMKNKQRTLLSNIKRDKLLILFVLPAIIYYIIFHYLPMIGLVISFQDYKFTRPFTQVFTNDFVGFEWFKEFINSFYFWRLIRNTLLLSIYSLMWGFPIPIIFALMLNEVRNKYFKKIVQSVSYFPHFVSLVVVVAMMSNVFSPTSGVVNVIIQKLGGDPINFFRRPEWFRTLYVSSHVWSGFGWNSIIYLAVISTIPQSLYEAAFIDGATRFKKAIYVTLPALIPTAIILFLLRIGKLFTVSYGKVILMYSPATYETADIISTYVFRKGVEGGLVSYATAVGFFNSMINFTLLIFFNRLCKKITKTSLW